MFKRFFVMLLCAGLLFSFPVSAQSELKSDAPEPTNLRWDVSQPGEVRAVWDIPENTYCSYNVFLYKADTQISLSSTSLFITDSYAYMDLAEYIALNGSGTYSFEVTASLNGESSNAVKSDNYTYSPAENTINSAEITGIIEPAGGELILTSADVGAPCTVGGVEWLVNGSIFYGIAFAYNTEFTASIKLCATEGYRFSNMTNVSVNGKNGKITKYNDFSCTVEYKFDATGTNPNTYLRINDTDVLSHNAKIPCGSGFAEYNSATNTLLLNNCTIKSSAENDSYNNRIYTNKDINIQLDGVNEIIPSKYDTAAIFLDENADVTFTRNGDLIILDESSDIFSMTRGIYTASDVTISGGNLVFSNLSTGIECDNLNITNGKLTGTVKSNDVFSGNRVISCNSLCVEGENTYVNAQILFAVDLTIKSGEIEIGTTEGDSPDGILNVNNNLTIESGKLSVNGSYYAFNLTAKDGNLTSNGTAHIANSMTVSGGVCSFQGDDIGLFATCDINISGGTVIFNSSSEYSEFEDCPPQSGVGLAAYNSYYDYQTEKWAIEYSTLYVTGGMVQITGDRALFAKLDCSGYDGVKVKAGDSTDINSACNLDSTENISSKNIKSIVIDTVDVPKKLLKGDADRNGTVDSKDALTVLQYTVGKAEFTEEQKELADVNNDLKNDSGDALKILQYIVGKADF